jgi:hypothetical protein
LKLQVAVSDVDKTDMVIKVEDAAPTVAQVVAYERFWKMVVERLLRKHEKDEQSSKCGNNEKLAARSGRTT